MDLGGTFPGGGLWAVRGSRLLVSTAGGSSWRQTTIPAVTGSLSYSLGAMVALDANHVWTVRIGPGSTEQEGDPQHDVLHYVVDRTSDGGRTWQTSTVAGSYPDTGPQIVFLDPSHGYLLASAQRHSAGRSTVLRTDDGGTTWSVAGTRDWLGSIFSIGGSEALWSGAPQDAGGLFEHPLLAVSRDDGRTWSDVTLPGIPGHTDGDCSCWLSGPPVFVSSTQGEVAVTGSDANGQPVTWIYATADAGRTWRRLATLSVEATAGLAALDPATWLLPTDDPLGLERSADGGRTWQRLVPAGLQATDTVVSVGRLSDSSVEALDASDDGTLLELSTDRGATWQPAELPTPVTSEQPNPTATPGPTDAPRRTPTPSPSPSPSPSAGVTDVQPAEGLAFFDARHGLMVGTDGVGRGLVWRTADGGRTWTKPVAIAPGPLESLTVVGTSRAWGLQACLGDDPACPSAVWASIDGGRIWQRLGSVPAYALSFADPQHGWAVAADDGAEVGQADASLFETTDGGTTWRAVADPCRPDLGWAAAVSFADPTHGWVGCLGISGAGETPKAIVETVDGGRTWSLRSAAFPPGRADVGTITLGDDLAGLAMRPDGIGMAWGSRGLTMRTADGGRTWRSMPPGEWDVVDATSGWATSDSAWTLLLWDGGRGRQIVESTTDGGRSWAVVAVVSPVHSTG